MINKDVEYLVRRLKLAKGAPGGKDWGGTVFLIGAGCSVTAGIRTGAGVARYCAELLAEKYGAGNLSADDALEWLIKARHVPEHEAGTPRDWGRLYNHFFQEHLSSPDRHLIDESGDKINWAHICIGELVYRRCIHTVLTTNFDQLVQQGIIRTGILPVVADGIEALNRITDKPRRPQVVHLHGSMHTYELRNSRKAVLDTERDPKLRSILYNVLQHCDLLVVVGYAGGEEGVMRLLIEAAHHIETLNVLWVMFDKEEGKLTAQARELLELGDHKYLISGYDADLLFQDIMRGLEIGEPEWMKSPLLNLQRQSALFAETKSLEDVSKVVQDYQRRVEVYASVDPPEPSAEVKSAILRLRGKYTEVIHDIAFSAMADDKPELVRVRALSRYNLAQEDDSISDLTEVVADFESVIPKLSGEQLSNTYTHLLDTLTLAHERAKDDAMLERLYAKADEALKAFPREADEALWATFLLRRAQAGEQLGQKSNDEARLEAALMDFGAAADFFRSTPLDRRYVDAKTGVATTSQMLGVLRKSPELLDVAVSQLRDLASGQGDNRESPEVAARLRNLFEALEQASRFDVANSTSYQEEAVAAAQKAIHIYLGANLLDEAMEVEEELLKLQASRERLSALSG